MFTCERAITCNFAEEENSMRPAVAYIRVSKPKQGRSGLGLEAQQAAIKAFCAQHGYKVEAEYREVETGKGSDALERRPELGQHEQTLMATLRSRRQGARQRARCRDGSAVEHELRRRPRRTRFHVFPRTHCLHGQARCRSRRRRRD